MNSMVELRGATAGYGTRTVLRAIDLTIAQRSFVVITGANGSGKSTLLKVIGGTLPARGERLEVQGIPLDCEANERDLKVLSALARESLQPVANRGRQVARRHPIASR